MAVNNLSWSNITGTISHISENHYLLVAKPEIKECCNILSKYFNLVNNKLEFFINHTREVHTPDHIIPIVKVDAFMLKFDSDVKSTEKLIDRINQVFEDKKLNCKLKKKTGSTSLTEQHNFILEEECVDTYYDTTYEKQQMTIKDINLMPYVTEV